jgi:hypothetical protein
MFAKKLSLVLVVAAALGSSGLAVAGKKLPAPVQINIDPEGGGSAEGSAGGARGSSDNNARIGCQVVAGKTGSVNATCLAVDSNGQTAGCHTTNANLIGQIRSIESDSFIVLEWDTDAAECQFIWVGTDSAYRPKPS